MKRTALTISQAMDSIGLSDWVVKGKCNRQLFSWPPDSFAACAYILQTSGAYLQCARPHRYKANEEFRLENWPTHSAKVASKWKILYTEEKVPREVAKLLDAIAEMRDLPVEALSEPSIHNLKWLPFVKLLCIADDACAGVGILYAGSSGIAWSAMLHIREQLLLRSRAMRRDGEEKEVAIGRFSPVTLGKQVDQSRVIVVPKMRTSQRGVTLRSLTNHLALFTGSDVEPVWNPTTSTPLDDIVMSAEQIASKCGPHNILLVPWPNEVLPTQFVPVTKSGAINKMMAGRPPSGHSFFSFVHKKLDKSSKLKLRRLINNARRIVGRLHGIVFPEMSMTRNDFNLLFGETLPKGLDFVACGVYECNKQSPTLARNYAIVRRRIWIENPKGEKKEIYLTSFQDKHHRWAITGEQVENYGIATSLHPNTVWWEGIDLRRRSLNFHPLGATSTFSVLICEDLARPDPVGDAVRAVGPNLVIALLMDGPQLSSRWSARYAAVLADDPGSSVLTFSSLGMVKLSRVRDKLHESSRVVALWREPEKVPVQLELPQGAEGLLLTLTNHFCTESTIDGRNDGGYTSMIRLGSYYPIYNT